MPSSVFAQMMATSAMEASPIQRFAPLRTQPSPSDQVAGGHPGQPALLLLLGSELVDRAHGERSLDADERTQAGVAGFEFHGGEAVLDGTAAGAAVAGQVHAEQAQRRHLLDDLAREVRGLVPVGDVRCDPLGDERADPVAQIEFVRRK
jgi:hypothetical protein